MTESGDVCRVLPADFDPKLGLGDGDEADSPMSLPDGLERFTREENE